MTTKQCKIIFISVFFLLPELVFGQILHNHELELKKYLDPPIDTLTTREVGFSISVTNNLTPEYSIRIVKVNKHYELEARILDRNLSKAISDYDDAVLRGNERGVFSVGTFTYIIPITDSLKSRMVNIFNKVITYDDYESVKSLMTANADGTISVMVYDGPVYQFRVCENRINSHKSIDYPLDSSDYIAQVIRTNQRIIEDLRNNSFDESKYNIYK